MLAGEENEAELASSAGPRIVHESRQRSLGRATRIEPVVSDWASAMELTGPRPLQSANDADPQNASARTAISPVVRIIDFFTSRTVVRVAPDRLPPAPCPPQAPTREAAPMRSPP